MHSEPTVEAGQPVPPWRPLSSVQRRVAGVLVEKAKTTPDAYPLTLNALTTGCNQKSNRDPQMNLSPDQLEQALEELRELGAVLEIQAGARVPKYRHCLYQWLGVDKVELAVIAELLLRGPQTVGELRTRAARMEPIADLGALRPVLDSLIQKGLVIPLTPEGRGQVVTHGLYPEREKNELLARYQAGAAASPAVSAATGEAAGPPPAAAPANPAITADMLAEVRLEVAQLRAEVARLREQLQQLEDQVLG